MLDGLPALRLLVTTGLTNASINMAAARARGVTVCGTSGTTNAVPELTLGMIIALTRNFAAEDAAVRAGGWQHTIGPGLAGATLGVVGLGRLGTPVARLAQALGMYGHRLVAAPDAGTGRAARRPGGIEGGAVQRGRRHHDPHAAVGRQPRTHRGGAIWPG